MKYIWLCFAIISLVRAVQMLGRTFTDSYYSPNLGALIAVIFASILFSILTWRGFRK